jgi:hypothetical protein
MAWPATGRWHGSTDSKRIPLQNHQFRELVCSLGTADRQSIRRCSTGTRESRSTTETQIAQAWNVEPDFLYREHAKGRQEFMAALYEVVVFYRPGSRAEIERECGELLALLK